MFLDHFASSTPDRPAYIMAGSGTEISFRTLADRTVRGANLLRGLGLKPGDRVVLYSENSASFLEIALSCIRCGLYFVPAGRHLKEQEVIHVLTDSGARVLIVSDLCAKTTPFDRLPANIEQVYLSEESALSYPQWGQALEGLAAETYEAGVLGSVMFYSSGTTGQPKGIYTPLSTARSSFWETPLRYESSHLLSRINTSENINLVTGPMYHISPFYFAVVALALGGTAIIMERFDAEWMLSLIGAHRITHVYMVPTMFARLLALSASVRMGYDVSSLRHVEHGSAPCPIDVKARMIEWLGPILYEVYGATEPAGSTSITSPEWLSHRGSVGRANFGSVHILDEHQNELDAFHVGDIFFSGANIEFDYFNAPEKKSRRSTREGWFSYGDIGYLARDGYLYLVDRRDNLIIVGGQKVYPLEIEQQLASHEAVLDVGVVGLADPIFGQRVHAYVQLRNSDAASAAMTERLMSHCRDRLADYKCPSSIEFVAGLPRTEHGKLLKRYLTTESLIDSSHAVPLGQG